MIENVEVIIVGAGPAGLSAASVLSKHKLTVCMIDEQVGPGGQIWRNADPAHQWPGVNYCPASTVIDIGTQNDISVTWLQHTAQGKLMRESRSRALIVATGAMERPLLFTGAHLPGVMGIGAVQSMLKQAHLVPHGPGVILAGQGPLLLLTVKQIVEQGASIDAVLDLSLPHSKRKALKRLPGALMSDPSLLLQGMQLLRSLPKTGIKVWKNVTALHATGNTHIEQVHFVSDGRQQQLPARLLAIHDGVIPNPQLTRLLNLEHHWSEMQQSFSATRHANGQSSHPQIWIAGDGAGIAGVDVAVLRGRLGALSVVSVLKTSATRASKNALDVEAQQLERIISKRLIARDFVDTLYAPLPVDHLAADDTIVCRCEAITLETVRGAIAQGAVGPNRIKTFTRCGMGACQGRQCSPSLTRIVMQATGQTADAVGALRIRPPLKPTLIADYLGTPFTQSRDANETA